MSASMTRAFFRPFRFVGTSYAVRPAMMTIHTTRNMQYAYKDDQDRESLKPRSTEYTRSGADNSVASESDAAFNPSKTSPDAAKKSAKSNGNPLEFSGANQELSKPHGDERDSGYSGAGKEMNKRGSSGSGSPPKGKKVQ